MQICPTVRSLTVSDMIGLDLPLGELKAHRKKEEDEARKAKRLEEEEERKKIRQDKMAAKV